MGQSVKEFLLKGIYSLQKLPIFVVGAIKIVRTRTNNNHKTPDSGTLMSLGSLFTELGCSRLQLG